MHHRRNQLDVTSTVDVTDAGSVGEAVEKIFLNLYPNASAIPLRTALSHVSRLYHGEHPEFAACDTGYHDMQHILDVTLASARLMDGYERSHRKADSLGPELFAFGIMLALFHDSGYLRKRGSEDNRRGAEFTMVHVSRSEELLKYFLQKSGMGSVAIAAAQVVHYTGYEIPADRVKAPSPAYQTVGYLVATADILAQMSDRCYLEKCHDRLYTEFVLGGIAKKQQENGKEQVIFASPQDLVVKTPAFYQVASKRLNVTLKSFHRYAEKHFGGQNLYLEGLEKNIRFAEYVAAHNADISLLKRIPPDSPGSEQTTPAAVDRKQLVEERRIASQDRKEDTAQQHRCVTEKGVTENGAMENGQDKDGSKLIISSKR